MRKSKKYYVLLILKDSNEMIKRVTKLSIGIFYILFVGQLFAQDRNRQELIDNYANEYLQFAGEDAALFSGYQQKELPLTTNLPYLNNKEFVKGRLSYNNTVYPEVLLKFDLYRNELITLSGFQGIVLFPENVNFAELLGKHIIYFHSDSLPGCPPSGYYFLLNSGKCTVLEKRTASLNSYSGSNTSQNTQYYNFKSIFYLYREGVYHPIRNEKSLLKFLYPYQKELKQYISSLSFKYKNFPDIVITLTVDQYEKLSELR